MMSRVVDLKRFWFNSICAYFCNTVQYVSLPMLLKTEKSSFSVPSFMKGESVSNNFNVNCPKCSWQLWYLHMYSRLEKSAHNPIWTKGHNHQESNSVELAADQLLSREIVFYLLEHLFQSLLFLEAEVGTVFRPYTLKFHPGRHRHHLVCCRLELDFSSTQILPDMFQL